MKSLMLLGMIALNFSQLLGNSPNGLGLFQKKIENPDKSITIVRPQISYGKNVYLISTDYNYRTCKYFGYDNFLDAQIETENFPNESWGKVMTLNVGGLIGQVASSKTYLTSITCYHSGDLKTLLSYDSKTTNQDGSTTFTNPGLIRGTKVEKLSGDYYGICKVFEFKNYLRGTVVLDSNQVTGLWIKWWDGVNSYFQSINPVTEITCY